MTACKTVGCCCSHYALRNDKVKHLGEFIDENIKFNKYVNYINFNIRIQSINSTIITVHIKIVCAAMMLQFVMKF